jgi:hypothetical protein
VGFPDYNYNQVTVLPTTTVREAMHIVTEKRIRHLPVLEICPIAQATKFNVIFGVHWGKHVVGKSA